MKNKTNIILVAVVIFIITLGISYPKLIKSSTGVNKIGKKYEVIVNSIITKQGDVKKSGKIHSDHKIELKELLKKKRELDEQISGKPLNEIIEDMEVDEKSIEDNILSEYCKSTKLTDIKNPAVSMELMKELNPNMTLEEIRCEFKTVNSNY